LLLLLVGCWVFVWLFVGRLVFVCLLLGSVGWQFVPDLRTILQQQNNNNYNNNNSNSNNNNSSNNKLFLHKLTYCCYECYSELCLINMRIVFVLLASELSYNVIAKTAEASCYKLY
jgi:hypothetical protein